MLEVQTVAIQVWIMTGRAEMALTQPRKGPASNLLPMPFVEWAGCSVLLKGHLQRNLEFQTEVEVSTSSTAHHLSTQTPGGEGFLEEPRGEGFPWSMWALDKSSPMARRGTKWGEEDNLWSRPRDRWRFSNGGVGVLEGGFRVHHLPFELESYLSSWFLIFLLKSY